jgi:hypothetical protein
MLMSARPLRFFSTVTTTSSEPFGVGHVEHQVMTSHHVVFAVEDEGDVAL